MHMIVGTHAEEEDQPEEPQQNHADDSETSELASPTTKLALDPRRGFGPSGCMLKASSCSVSSGCYCSVCHTILIGKLKP